jgi:hypothetical protein
MQAIKARVREAERADLEKGDNATGANGFLLMKFREPKISRLVTNGKIGQVELQACDEIERVWQHLCAGLWLRGMRLGERVDRGISHDPPWFIEAYHDRYLPWAKAWTQRRVTHRDRTQEVVYDYLFSDACGKSIDADRNWPTGTAVRVFVGGLRDYAARAGWVDRGTGFKWTTAAQGIFPLKLAMAA